MASKIENLAGIFKNTKSRTLFLMTIGVIVVGLLLAVGGLHRSISSSGSAGDASLPTAPRITGDPDILGKHGVSQQRAKLAKEADDQAVWDAARKGDSALPTSFNQPISLNGQDINEYNQQQQQQLDKLVSQAEKIPAQDNQKQQSQPQLDEQDDYEDDEDRQRDLEEAKLQSIIQSDDGTPDDLSGAMAAEVKQLLASWNPTAQQYVRGASTSDNQQAQDSSAASTASTSRGAMPNPAAAQAASTASDKPLLLQAGTILFGVLQTAVNTDQPGPVMVTVEVGPYRGAKLLGSLQPAGRYAEGVVLQFNTMVLPNEKKSISVNAFAIDPDTARTALASDVDHHYLLRYGSLFASSFLSGLGQAVAMSGQTTVNDSFGGSTTVHDALDTKDKLLYALGNVGTQASNEINKLSNRPTTVTIDSGTGIGILYMKDVASPSTS